MTTPVEPVLVNNVPVEPEPVVPEPVVAPPPPEPEPEPTFFDVWSGAVDTFSAARKAVREAKEDLAEGEFELDQAKSYYDSWVSNVTALQADVAQAETDSKTAARLLAAVLDDYLNPPPPGS